jgi:pyruvate dehydrogenase E2 component (dihydrolipoamide acetyltransferase)
MSATVEVKVPDIGDFKEVEVIELLVKVGDRIAVDQSLITVESDKASMEIPSSTAGIVKSLSIKLGDKVAMGSVLLVLEPSDAGASVAAAVTAPVSAPAPVVAKAAVSVAEAIVATNAATVPASTLSSVAATTGAYHASPSARKYARELGVALERVVGSGPKGRITADDITAFVKGVIIESASGARTTSGSAASGNGLSVVAWPSVDFAKFGPVTAQPMSRIKKISGPALHRNWVTIPHVTNHDDADITELEAFRVKLNQENEKSGVKLTMLAFLIKACVTTLKKFPEFNSSLDGDQIVLKQYWHIGFAADTPNGLVVPVIRDADKKGLFEIAAETSELAKKARDGKLSPADMQGGTFSISSLGGIGGTYFTPIINAPEVAILGVCRSAIKPVWDGAQFAPRLILPMSLSWDHRVVDGASAARFNSFLASLLADFRRTML